MSGISESDVREAIAGNATGVEDAWSIPVDADLKDYGADSLDMYTTIAELQEKTGLEPSDEDFRVLTTIEAIARYFSQS